MEEGKLHEPLLSSNVEDQNQNQESLQSLPVATDASATAAIFVAGVPDILPIENPRDFFREFLNQSKKLWYLAGPAIFTSLCRYSLGAVTQVFAGHVSTLALAAFSVENSVIAGFSFGIMART